MKIARTVVALAAAAWLAAGCSTPTVTTAYQRQAPAAAVSAAGGASLQCTTADDRYGCLFSFVNPGEVAAAENEVALISSLRRQLEIDAPDAPEGAGHGPETADIAALAAECRKALRSQRLLSWRSGSEVYVPMQSLLGLLYAGKAVATDASLARKGRKQQFTLRYAWR
ncbi:MAG: hypothetical protein KGN16_07665 [Burkholderiales bacterium]|nr:hypothetical protein [Burkholderiales bacterium]